MQSPTPDSEDPDDAPPVSNGAVDSFDDLGGSAAAHDGDDGDDGAEDDTGVRGVGAPRVEIIVVAHEPDESFEETLHSLASQDYVRQNVTVVVTGQEDVVAARVRSILPDAAIRNVDESNGYGRCANEALSLPGNRPAFFLFCHDDVALAPDAVRLLVEEAIRSNAAIVGPKLVHWDRPDVLLEVGLDVDKLAHVAPRIEVGELDQEQHDAVTDVFAVSGAVQLVRADLFEAVGGFDATMGMTGEDVDLCWRTHVAGGRVLVVPSAVARHRAAIVERHGDAEVERLRERHRVRTVLTAYGVVHSVRVVPQALGYTLVRTIVALVTGQFSRARSGAGAWLWNARHPSSLLSRRAGLRRLRQVPDSDIRQLQVGGYAPVSTFLRGQFVAEGTGSVAVRSRHLLEALRSGPSRVSIGFWMATALALSFGSRHLITRRVPVVGDLVPFDLGIGDLFSQFFSSWRSTGVGADEAAPTAFALVGAGGIALFGAVGLLRTILTVGMIPIGAIGMWRFLRPFSSPWIRVAGTMMYLASPVAYDALADGTWSALLLHGSLPWVLAALARAARLAPFGRVGGSVGEGVLVPSLTREVLGFGLLLGMVGAFVPFVLVISLGSVLAIIAGSWLAGQPAGAGRLLGVTAGSFLVAAILNLPWMLDLLTGSAGWNALTGTRPEGASMISVPELLALDTGPTSGGVIGWALPITAIVPLMLARGPRWGWAVRGVLLYLAAVGAAWSSARGWIALPMPRTEVLLVAGSAGLAIAAAMGIAAIESDLRTYRLGWRQLMPVTAVIALTLAMVPVTIASFDGLWHMPGEDYNRQFAPDADASSGRVLWIGHDDVVSAAGQPFGDGLTLAVTADVGVGFADRWPRHVAPSDPLVADAVQLALDGGTSRLGQLLAPFAITEIIVIEQSAPAPQVGVAEPVPTALLDALTEQLDLAQIDVAPGLVRLFNTSALEVASVVAQGSTAGVTLRDFAAQGLDGDVTGLTTTNRAMSSFEGPVTVGDEVYLAVPGSAQWRLVVDGRAASRGPALEVGTAFTPSVSGRAVLRHRTDSSHLAMMVGQCLLWLAAVVALLRIHTNAREARP